MEAAGGNVGLVQAVFEAWNDGNMGSVAPLMADDLEWLEVEGAPDAARSERRGRDEIISSLGDLFEAWEHYRLEPQEVRDVGNGRVLAVVKEIARGRASGIDVASDWGYLMTVRDGKIVRIEAYRSPEAALEAAGLPQ